MKRVLEPLPITPCACERERGGTAVHVIITGAKSPRHLVSPEFFHGTITMAVPCLCHAARYLLHFHVAAS